jgi:hypothetical protein
MEGKEKSGQRSRKVSRAQRQGLLLAALTCKKGMQKRHASVNRYSEDSLLGCKGSLTIGACIE